ncbi:hypothetical protein [Actinomadura atramentaria]|uniref:hypothetical protein n=1 Tax=Actinomadura atramentaria TaxID=1990 RepID=UPI00036D3738|nr:hypothetical protein [Actinomadura atramentaria]
MNEHDEIEIVWKTPAVVSYRKRFTVAEIMDQFDPAYTVEELAAEAASQNGLIEVARLLTQGALPEAEQAANEIEFEVTGRRVTHVEHITSEQEAV